MVRGVLVYGAASLLGLTLCIAETLKYAHQLQQAAAVLQTADSAVDPSSSPVPLPASPFESVSSVLSSLPFLLTIASSTASLPGFRRFLAFFLRSKVNEVVALNVVVSVLAAAVRVLQLRLFGPLSDNEAKACRENLFNFLVFRSVFVAAIVPLDVRELMVWCAFFAVIAALRLLCIIARERFATVTILPSATADTFMRVIALIAALLLVDVLLAALVWLLVRRAAGLSVLCLLLFENAVVLLGCLKVSGKYLIHLLGLRRGQGWEERNSYLYYCEFVFEVLTQLLTLLHYLHVWSFYGLSVTIIDLFLFLHLRSSFIVLVDRISKYHHYRRASVEINSRYADATQAELEQADDFCAICREGMDSAKKLPCGHLFHRSCITQWMEYKGICPSCRAPLLHTAAARETAAAQQRQQQQQQQQRLAAMYPAQAAAHLAAQQQQSAADSGSGLAASGLGFSPAPAAPPVNDDNLEATMALIRQLQAQDAAQFGMLGFGMLSLGGGGSRRGGTAASAAAAAAAGSSGAADGAMGDAEMQSGHERALQSGGSAASSSSSAHHAGRAMLGRSLFHFNSRSIASWLPSFSFELVRSVAEDTTTPHIATRPQQQPIAPAVVPASGQPAVSAPMPLSASLAPSAASSASSSSSAPAAVPSSAYPAESTSPSSADEEKTAASLPSASAVVTRSSSSSDRSRRDVILEATQRRLHQHSAASASSSSASSSPGSPSSLSPAASSSASASAAPSQTSGALEDPATADIAHLVAEEREDASYDDINGGIGSEGGAAAGLREEDEEEWSDEEAIVQRIRPALESAVRHVEVHALPPPPTSRDSRR